MIKKMKNLETDDIHDLLPSDLIQPFQVVSKSKTHSVETIQVETFREYLIKSKILHFGEELSDALIEFLELSPDHDHLLMIKKLIKAIKEVWFIAINQKFRLKRANISIALELINVQELLTEDVTLLGYSKD